MTSSPVAEVNFDHDRQTRVGLPEAVLCESKSDAQLAAIFAAVAARGAPLLLTRLTAAQRAGLAALAPTGADLDVCAVSRTAFFAWQARPPRAARVAVVSAGSTDVPVAKEAVRTLRFMHVEALEVYDVGVAGLHRYLARAPELRTCDVVIACAGMDAALVSVIGGDVPGVVIAVPTSVGYGVAAQGASALHASLASCASGVVVVNIDNGYGAACAALRALRLSPAT
jgi:NCAIR mutase (PurE)-related protein